MRAKLTVTLLGLCATAIVLPLFAHHDVAAQYDIDKIVTIQGVVTKTEWANPHMRFWVDVKNADATVASWEMELLPPNTLKRQGVNQDFIKQGDSVTVDGWSARDGSRFIHTLTLILSGGGVMKFPRDLAWKSK